MKTTQRMRWAMSAVAIAGASTLAGAFTTNAQSAPDAPFSFDVYDSDDGAVPNLSGDGKFLYSTFAGRPDRVDLDKGTSEASGGFGDGVLSGRFSFVENPGNGTFTRLDASGGVTTIESLPWVPDGSNVLAADEFGRFVVADTDQFAIHDTVTGNIWQPNGPETDRPVGPNSISADGNRVLFEYTPPRCCAPSLIVYERGTGQVLAEKFTYSLGSSPAISGNGRFLVVGLTGALFRHDLLLRTETYIGNQTGGDPADLAIGNDGQIFWIAADGHAYRHAPGDVDGPRQIDVSPTGEPGNAPVEHLRISQRGDRVVFTSAATNLAQFTTVGDPGNVNTFVGTAEVTSGYVSMKSRMDGVAVHPKQAHLDWDDSATQYADMYAIYRNQVEVAQTIGSEIELNGLTSGRNFYQARTLPPVDRGVTFSRRSVPSASVMIKTDYDGTRPTLAANLVAEQPYPGDPRRGHQWVLSWDESTDNSNVVRYAIYDRNTLIRMVDTPSVQLSLFAGSTHYFQVRTWDLNGNTSVKTPPLFVQG